MAGITRDAVLWKNRKNAQCTTGCAGARSFRLGNPVCRATAVDREVLSERTTRRRGALFIERFCFIAQRVVHRDAGSA